MKGLASGAVVTPFGKGIEHRLDGVARVAGKNLLCSGIGGTRHGYSILQKGGRTGHCHILAFDAMAAAANSHDRRVWPITATVYPNARYPTVTGRASVSGPHRASASGPSLT